MLRKLIKYEWKRVYKLECILLLVLIVVSIMGAIMFHTPMGTAVFHNQMDVMTDTEAMIMMAWVITFTTSIMVYIVMIIGVTYGNLIFLGVNFFKTMYTDEGYLSHTLPVKPHQLLASKFIVGFLWTFIIQVAMFISIVVMVISMMIAIEPTMMNDFSSFVTAVVENFERVLVEVEALGVILHYCLMYIGLLLVSPLANISMIFGGLTIGQLANKYKALVGIACYFGLTFVNQIIATLCQIVGTMAQMGTMLVLPEDAEFAYMHSLLFFSYDLQIIMMLLLSIALYFMSHYIISNKLNLN